MSSDRKASNALTQCSRAIAQYIYAVCKVFCSILTHDDFVENLQSQLLSLFYSNFELRDIPRNLFPFIKTSIVAKKVSCVELTLSRYKRLC